MSDETARIGLIRRRDLLKSVVKGAMVIQVTSSAQEAQAQSKSMAAPPKLDEKDPQAIALGYVADATKVDAKANPTFKRDQTCATCLQISGHAGDSFQNCNLFPGKSVNANGWCKAWMRKA